MPTGFARPKSSAVLIAAVVTVIVPLRVAQGGGLEELPLPAVQTHPLQPQQMVQRVAAPMVDFDAVTAQDVIDESEGMPPRFAINNPTDLTPSNSGTWESLDEQNSVWRLRVASRGAVSLNFGFTRYNMPEGGRMFIYSSDLRMVLRPFTAADNFDHHQLWTPPVVGEEAVIEVTVPNHARRQLDLTLGSINVGYKPFAIPTRFRDLKNDDGSIASGSCNVDVKCAAGTGWANQIAGVAVIAFNNVGSRFCSGSMVNNTSLNRRNFFLTAAHCGVTAANAATLVCIWNYENSTCRTPGSAASGGVGNGPLTMFNTGSTHRATATVSDFTLVELSAAPNPAWGVTYNGWDRAGAFPPSGSCIHHPDTDEKRITLYNIASRPDRPTHSSSWGCSTFPGPGDGTHIKVYWALNAGVTEPGSSGSPLFDNNKRIIGQLHGGASICGATGDNLSDCYGRVWRSWTGNGTSATRLSDWLDPGNTGATAINTVGRCAADINGSNAVDTDDLITLIGAWGACPAPCPTNYCHADIATPKNCLVNTDDLLVIIGSWGACPQ